MEETLRILCFMVWHQARCMVQPSQISNTLPTCGTDVNAALLPVIFCSPRSLRQVTYVIDIQFWQWPLRQNNKFHTNSHLYVSFITHIYIVTQFYGFYIYKVVLLLNHHQPCKGLLEEKNVTNQSHLVLFHCWHFIF